MTSLPEEQVLLLADGLVHHDRFMTGAARCVFEAARCLSRRRRVTILGSTDGDSRVSQLGDRVTFVRSARGIDAQIRAAESLLADEPVGLILVFLDQTLPLGQALRGRLRGDPSLVYWMQVEPGPMHPMEGLAAASDELDALFLLTRHQQKALEKQMPALVNRSRVVGIGIRPPEGISRASLPPGASCQVMFVGRLSFAKGYDVFLAAAEQLVRRSPAARLCTVGEFDRALPEIGFQRRNRLLCSGHLEEHAYLAPRELWKRMSAADVLVLPTRTDCVPIVILEAWNLGIPVVASAIPNLVELDAGRGILFFPASYSGRSFVSRIEEVLRADGEVESALSKAREVARAEHSDTAMAAGLEAALSEMPSSRARSGA